MLEYICNSCNTYLNEPLSQCPNCQINFVFSGKDKNITDSLAPNCLVHRYQGSDLLEKATVLREGKTNMKVAVKLKDLAKPLTVPKSEVFKIDEKILNNINNLRSERKAQMAKYDEDIANYWENLQFYTN